MVRVISTLILTAFERMMLFDFFPFFFLGYLTYVLKSTLSCVFFSLLDENGRTRTSYLSTVIVSEGLCDGKFDANCVM